MAVIGPDSTLVYRWRLNLAAAWATKAVPGMKHNAMESPMIGTFVLIVVAVLAIHTAVRASAVSSIGTRGDTDNRPAPGSEEQAAKPRSPDHPLERSSERSLDRSLDPSLENVAA